MIFKSFIYNQEVFLKHPVTQKSINPEQYDSPNISWNPQEKVSDSPVRKYMSNFLLQFIQASRGRCVLEIGCGTGWLLSEVLKYRPNAAIGIEPSSNNVRIAKQLNLSIDVRTSNFQDFQTDNIFDDVYIIMTLSHFWDLDWFFAKCNRMMRESGKLIIIVPNFEYFQKPRDGYDMEIVYFQNQYAVSILKDSNSLSQIVRKNEIYNNFATKNGFAIVIKTNIKINNDLAEQDKKFRNFIGNSIWDLLVYKKRTVVS